MEQLTEHLGQRLKVIVVAGIVTSTVILNGCTTGDQPHVRFGSYATPTPGTRYLDINSLGRHSYKNSLSENNGIVYTCRGGHIDITHLRIGADNVKYLHDKIRKHLMNNDSGFSFKLNVEPSLYFVKLQYPDNWQTLPQEDKKRIADEAALEMSQSFAYTMTTWHEVLTWFGYKTVTFWSEEPSAFSWEDIYSNLVGVRLGAQAIQDEEHSFDSAMTILIKKELENLQIQSAATAKQAAEKMRGKWFTGFILVDMRERNMDIGLDDGFVTPTLVPGICEGAEPQSYPVPTLDKFYKYSFEMTLEVEPKEFEKDKILRLVYPGGGGKRIRPFEHLPLVMDYIKIEAIKKGFNIAPPIIRKSDLTAKSLAGEHSQNPAIYHQP